MFDQSTYVRTQRGWIKAYDIRSLDSLLVMDRETQDISWCADHAVTSEYYGGPMEQILAREVDILVTPYHQVMAYHLKWKNMPERFRSVFATVLDDSFTLIMPSDEAGGNVSRYPICTQNGDLRVFSVPYVGDVVNIIFHDEHSFPSHAICTKRNGKMCWV